MNHTEIINHIIKSRNYESYLEIGVQNPFNNFYNITADYCVGIDPNVSARNVMTMTSDKFFKYNSTFFDVIFVDGDHSYDQSMRDIENAYQHVSSGGIILVHDVNPATEQAASPTQAQKGTEWNGEVYRAWAKIRGGITEYSYTIDTDYGIGVIESEVKDDYRFKTVNVDWAKFSADRNKWLDLVTVEDWLKGEKERELRRIAKQAKG